MLVIPDGLRAALFDRLVWYSDIDLYELIERIERYIEDFPQFPDSMYPELIIAREILDKRFEEDRQAQDNYGMDYSEEGR